MRWCFLTGIMATALISAGAASAQSRNIPPSLFSDVRAAFVGDIVTIIVNEQTTAQNNAVNQSQKSNALEVNSGAGSGALGFLPGFGVTSDASNAFQANANQTSRDQFTARVSATIVKVLENGNYLIRGSREVDTNGEKRVTVIEGEIRPSDITTQNTILSSQVANAAIFHQGKGLTHDGARPGIFVRILNWLF